MGRASEIKKSPLAVAMTALERNDFRSTRGRHCERSEAIQGSVGRPTTPGSPRRHSPSGRTGVSRRPAAPRDDGLIRPHLALGLLIGRMS